MIETVLLNLYVTLIIFTVTEANKYFACINENIFCFIVPCNFLTLHLFCKEKKGHFCKLIEKFVIPLAGRFNQSMFRIDFG